MLHEKDYILITDNTDEYYLKLGKIISCEECAGEKKYLVAFSETERKEYDSTLVKKSKNVSQKD